MARYRKARKARKSRRGSSSRRNRSHARSLRVRARRKQKRLKLKYSRHGYRKARRKGRRVSGKWSTVKRYRRKAHNPGNSYAAEAEDAGWVDAETIPRSSAVLFPGPWSTTIVGSDLYGRGPGAKKRRDLRKSGRNLSGREIHKIAELVQRVAGRHDASRFFEQLEVSRGRGGWDIGFIFGS